MTPDGDEIVEVKGAALVTISNELGEPRYPTTAKKLQARRMKPTVVPVDELGVTSLPQVLAQLALPDQALFDLSLSNSGAFVSCELEFGDLSDLSEPTTSLVVEAIFDGVSFGSVVVR